MQRRVPDELAPPTRAQEALFRAFYAAGCVFLAIGSWILRKR